ncbi:topoisomerase II-associated protein PAT1 [Desarmillaria tabescens]|uniref:Topoisomerase II-associated protein PAT1 n=1 Tax=Armillaria tabescens TaxID=1929756 RepID=A0AA39TQU8_ARMTA|nr:topoisomerase II-associated protein PAT1 [Desarmillaria tabescens]KAK0467322.1 topoisomerase II-associated protein PAT1 [Desarmillaria tabescens]
MSFFGFEQSDLEKEKQRFLEGGVQDTENLAVYTWGEESYDGLGDALQEGGDDFNDETFGSTGAVGKDFDFSNAGGLHDSHALPGHPDSSKDALTQENSALQVKEPTPAVQTQSSSKTIPARSLESLWDDKSPFSVLPRNNGAVRSNPSSSSSPFAPQSAARGPQTLSQNVSQSGVRTLAEIEAEMRTATQQSRQAAVHREKLLRRQQEEEYLREQELLRQQQEEEEYLRQDQELQRQRYLYQQEQLQMQRLQQQRELQQRELLQQAQNTPPPRMLPELQEQLRMESLERQLRAQQLNNLGTHHRQLSGQSLSPQPQHQHQRRQRSRSPSGPIQLQDNLSYHPQNIQFQQRLLSEMAQAEFLRDMQGSNPAEQEALRMEAMRKIVEAEKLEEKRRRRAAKIAHMSRYNDLMTQSDKDFITRIQVSQLVTQDPYADDFYAQAYGAIMRSRMGIHSQDERVLKFGSGGGIGLGIAPKGGHRRQSAMQKMEQQVERIVSNARRREEEKGLHSLHSLQGALGKTSGRSYKAAPRQLLQVDSSSTSSSPTLSHAHAHISKQDSIDAKNKGKEEAAAEAAKLGREALGTAADLTRREILTCLEDLHDLVLKAEQLKQEEPLPEEAQIYAEWEHEYSGVVDQMWNQLKVMVPIATSDPHPFISLLSVAKGKRVLSRLARHFDNQQMLTMLTLLIACFNQLDVFRQAPLLDTLEDTPERVEVERQTNAFLSNVLHSIVSVISNGSLRLVTGLLGLLLDRNNVSEVAQTQPGLSLLTLFLTRVQVIKEGAAVLENELPTVEDANQWRTIAVDIIDRPVWQFLAALALHALPEQQPILVHSLREKVLENVVSAKKGWVSDEQERRAKLHNVDLFLSALGLSSSQIDL